VIDQGEKWCGEDREALRRRVFPNAPANHEVLVFVSEGSARVLRTPSERLASYSVVGRGNRSGRTEIALEEVLEALPAVVPRPYVVLRAHPKDDPEDYAAYRQEINLISAGGDALEIVFAADLVVGTTSMLVTEAALLGRPTVAIVPVPQETQWLPSIALGLTRVSTSRADVVRLLQEGLRSTAAAGGTVSLRGARERATAALQGMLSSAAA
jgi:predicted glycosyltransferase